MALRVGWAVAVFLFVSHLNGRAEAYLDPGTGSMALQAVLGGIVGALTLLRMYRDRIKGFFLRRSTRDGAVED